MSHLTDHGFTLIKQGAEARIYTGMYLGKSSIVKERFSKKYRHPDLDTMLTKERTKSEARSILKALSCGLKTPKLYFVDYLNSTIYMENVFCSTLKDHLIDMARTMPSPDEEEENKVFQSALLRLMDSIGANIALLHENNIIHGDLTTSNMIISNNLEIVMIDFGLSYTSTNFEDKAVDLYVLERSFATSHEELSNSFESIQNGYVTRISKESKEPFEKKYEDVRSRGRKRTMVG